MFIFCLGRWFYDHLGRFEGRFRDFREAGDVPSLEVFKARVG